MKHYLIPVTFIAALIGVYFSNNYPSQKSIVVSQNLKDSSPREKSTIAENKVQSPTEKYTTHLSTQEKSDSLASPANNKAYLSFLTTENAEGRQYLTNAELRDYSQKGASLAAVRLKGANIIFDPTHMPYIEGPEKYIYLQLKKTLQKK